MDTLTPNRISNIGIRPLDVQEFLPALQKQVPMFDSVYTHAKIAEEKNWIKAIAVADTEKEKKKEKK